MNFVTLAIVSKAFPEYLPLTPPALLKRQSLSVLCCSSICWPRYCSEHWPISHGQDPKALIPRLLIYLDPNFCLASYALDYHIKLSHSRPWLFLTALCDIVKPISSFKPHNRTDQNARDTLVRYCNNRRRPRWPPLVSSTIKMGLQCQTHRQPARAHSDRTGRWHTTTIVRNLEKHGSETKDHGLRSCQSF